MAPYLAPHPSTQTDPTRIVFVPVDGRLVFAVCGLLVFLCCIWLGMLLHKGVEHDRDA